jgi:glycosyltransferase involved in cell wall biosynthesis
VAAVGCPVGGPRVRGAAVGFDLVQTLMYEASTKIVVGQERGITQDPNYAMGLQQLTQTMAEEVDNHRVAEAIIQQEGLRMTMQSTEIPNVAYIIVGDGSDRPRLEKKARALGVHDRVVFAGLISEAEKADHYRLADTYVMPGWGEGFGIVYLEAMACGIPVVASKVDGSREAVRHGALGIMVDPNDREDIRAGIIEALRRPTGVIPQGLDYFSCINFKRRLHRIIENVVSMRK